MSQIERLRFLDRLGEHQRILAVTTLVSAGFLTGNVLSADLNKHPVRDPLLCAAFAYAASRSGRTLFKSVDYSFAVMSHYPSPAEQVSYAADLLKSIAPLPGAMAIHFGTTMPLASPMTAFTVLCGSAAVATHLYGRHLHKQAALV